MLTQHRKIQIGLRVRSCACAGVFAWAQNFFQLASLFCM
jgi:hypothetical protein